MIGKKIMAVLLASTIMLGGFTVTVDAKVSTESKVTGEMCTADYWTSLMGDSANVVLMNQSAIANYNQLALNTPDCNMHDIAHMDSGYDATALKEALVADVIEQMPTKDTYANGVQIDQSAYYSAVANWVQNTAWDGMTYPKYALAVQQTQIKAIPTVDYIGYSDTDSDDEIILSSMRVNEPFLVKQCAVVNGVVFYYGYSNNVPGWVLGNDIAFCDTKNEWLNMWQTGIGDSNFLVVTGDEFSLSESYYSPATSNLKLTMGTTLKLVPENDVPRNIAMRGTWNNYVVYVPTRDANGKMVRQIALISQGKDVNVGYLPLTSANVLKLSFSYLGNTYGWGGMLDSVDCSAYVRNVYKCFGFEMPRNTSWQKKVPGTFIDVSALDDATKTGAIAGCLPGTPLYFPGHTMIYLGTVNGTCYVISALGSTSDSTGALDVKVQNSVAITSLYVRRRNGNTWLTSVDTIVVPWAI